MLHGRSIAVVVPAYNEALLLGRVLETMPDYVDLIVVVDDASTDATATIAEAFLDSRLRVLRHSTNRGVGAALMTGYAAAFGEGADIAAVMAGDAQMAPEDLLPLLEAMNRGADYAKGNRLAWPGVRQAMPPLRYLGNRSLSLLTRFATGLEIEDSQCGYTALSRRAYDALPMHRLWQGYGYPNDLLSLLAQHGRRVEDVPVKPVYGQEQSGIGWRHALVVIPMLLARATQRRFGGVRTVAKEPMAAPAKAETPSWAPHQHR